MVGRIEYHLLAETIEGNLSEGMRQLNGVYTQKFNRRHRVSGHLYQGRYKAVLVQKESHLLELSRYVVLNPVRAGMVESPEDWAWSSYATIMSGDIGPEWLDRDWMLSQFGKIRNEARQAYRQFVMEGVGMESPLLATRHQLLLGDDAFVEKHKAGNETDKLREMSIAHRRAVALSLHEYQEKYPSRNEAMARAYKSGAYKMSQIAEYFGVHYMTVSRAFNEFEKVDG